MKFSVQKPALPSLDLAPLIDVVFLLLIFFMVSTKLDTPLAMSIKLPEAKSIGPSASQVMMLSIDENGEMMLGDRRLDGNLRQQLEQYLQTAQRETPIQIAADQLTPHYFVVHAMDALSGLGFNQLQIVAEEKK